MPVLFQQYIGWSDPIVDGRLEVSPLSRMNNNFVRRLRLSNLNHADTGRYFCHKSGSPDTVIDHYIFVQGKVQTNVNT